MVVRYSIGKYVVLAAVLMFGGTSDVFAQAIDLNKINKIPHYSKMTQEEFEAKTQVFTEIPDGEKRLEYTIRLPVGWQKLGLTEEERDIQIEKPIVKPTADDPYGINNLRDQELLDQKNNIERSDEEDSEVADIEDDGMMISKHTLSRRDIYIPDKSDIGLMGPVAKYTGTANLVALSRLEIYATKLSHDITTRNWFLNYIISNNYTLTGMEQINDQRVDAEYVLNQKGISYVVRTAAISNGSRMVLVSYYVPEKFWDKEKELQEMSVTSFKFLNPEKVTIDDRRTHGFLDLVKFSYPAKWRLIAPNVYTIDTMGAKLLSSADSKILDGEIDINLISTELDTNLMKEVEVIRKDLKKRGFTTGVALDTNATYKFNDKITFNRVEAYEISGSKKTYIDYEFWLAIMVEDRYYYIVTMLTPGRKADFYKWARNTETFAMIIQSMMPQVAGETLDATFLSKTKGVDSGGAPVAP